MSALPPFESAPNSDSPQPRKKTSVVRRIFQVLSLLLFIGFVAVVGVVIVFDAGHGGGKVNSTRLKLKSVENALRQYSIDNNYPTQVEGLAVLVNPPGGEKPYLEANPKDAWNNDILYFNPARRGQGPFEVVSKGPDGEFNTEDDVYPKKRRRR